MSKRKQPASLPLGAHDPKGFAALGFRPPTVDMHHRHDRTRAADKAHAASIEAREPLAHEARETFWCGAEPRVRGPAIVVYRCLTQGPPGYYGNPW